MGKMPPPAVDISGQGQAFLMLDKIRQFIRHGDSGGSDRVTERVPEEQVAVAAILLEVANADMDFKPEEFREIMIQLRAYFGLSKEQVEELLEVSGAERERSTDLFPFTNAIARAYSPEKKQEVLTMVWQVIFADNRLDPYEDQLAGRLHNLLAVNHSVLMAAKAKAREIQKARADRGSGATPPPRH
jgi:uncharacterized tellurite resistance protein B-like protein